MIAILANVTIDTLVTPDNMRRLDATGRLVGKPAIHAIRAIGATLTMIATVAILTKHIDHVRPRCNPCFGYNPQTCQARHDPDDRLSPFRRQRA